MLHYLAALPALDLSKLVVGGGQGAQATSLGEVVARASSIIDTHCCGANGTLCASQNTETGRLRSDRRGRFIVKPKFFPILEVDAFSVGDGLVNALQRSLLSTANTWIEESQFIIAGYLGGLTTNEGPSSSPRSEVGRSGAVLRPVDLRQRVAETQPWPLQ